MHNQNYENHSFEIKKRIIEGAYNCGETCHIGGALSMVDFMSVLYGSIIKINPQDLCDPTRDIFILSKGHCVLGYFATLNHFGLISDDTFRTFQKNGSDLIAHPVKNIKLGMESSNGSLGQGLSFALGQALGMRYEKEDNRHVYVLMGDGECNEGSVWESAASAAEFKTTNLTSIIDVNLMRNDGENSIFEGIENIQKIWSAFGWNTIVVDGHNHSEILKALIKSKENKTKPSAILLQTIKGKGISFMENNNDWHHNRITRKIYDQILSEWKNIDNNR